MGAAGGPNMVEDGMVFYYDTVNSKSYKGEPTTNEFTTAFRDGASGLTGAGTLQPGVVGPFGRTTDPVFRKTNGKIRFGTIGSDIGTLYYGNTYTFSVYLRKVPGTTAPTGNEFDICDRKTATSWVGNWSDSLTYDWQRYWVTALHDTTSSYHFIDIGTYNTEEAFEWTCPQIELGTHPTQYVPYGTNHQTRSATEGLKDLTGNSTIDLTNVSFDSNAQMTFDGTDDDVDAGIGTDTSLQRTIEMVFKTNTIGYLYPLACYTRGGGQSVVEGKRMWLGFQDNKFRMHGWGTTDPASTTTIQTGQYYHAVYAYDQDTKKHYIWINGVLEDNSTNTQSGFPDWTASGDHSWFVGGDPDCASWTASAGRSLNGEIPIFKVYDRILTNEEVQNNFNAIKSRYGI